MGWKGRGMLRVSSPFLSERPPCSLWLPAAERVQAAEQIQVAEQLQQVAEQLQQVAEQLQVTEQLEAAQPLLGRKIPSRHHVLPLQLGQLSHSSAIHHAAQYRWAREWRAMDGGSTRCYFGLPSWIRSLRHQLPHALEE